MEEEQQDNSSLRPPPKCDSDCRDKPPATFQSQLDAYKLTQTACDLCLEGVHYSRLYCKACRATYCTAHLEEHKNAPATRTHRVYTYVYARAGWGRTVPWYLVLMVLVGLVAVVIPVFYRFSNDEKDGHVKAFVRDQRTQMESRMQGCEELYQAVEKQRLLLVQQVCSNKEAFRNQRLAVMSQIQEEHRRLLEVMGEDQEINPVKEFLMSHLDNHRNMLYALLDNQTNTAGVQKWCDEWPGKSSAAQSL